MAYEVFKNIQEARELLDDIGGWLLDLGPAHSPEYGVTDDEGIVRDLRGQNFIDNCQIIQCWDETQIL